MTKPCLVTGLAMSALMMVGCAEGGPEQRASVGTPEQRAELFDTILSRVERREAFSPVKNEALGVDPMSEMAALRDEFVAASDPVSFYYALSRLSNARRDRHLDVAILPDGLRLPDERGVPHAEESDDSAPLHAPLRVRPDYGTPGEVTFFVSDLPEQSSTREGPRLGDRIVSVNGNPFAEYLAAAIPYHRYSSMPNLWWRMALAFPERTALLPPEFYREELELELERLDGTVTRVALPYLEPESLAWQGASDPRYPGFALHHTTGTYDLYLPDPGGLDAVVLRWYGFRETLIEDVDSLMAFASREGLLDHAVIIDGTRSRGGSKGAYALQRFASRPFRVTFGNLRISDVTLPFIEEKRAEVGASGALDSGVGETMDDGRWLMDWLENDVLDSLEAGAEYTNDVPFKLAHLPKDSDGTLPPADVRFRGPLVLLLGPQGGSHLDQFAAQVIDNGLGRTIGMPAGGYSNTWEWEEVLTLPGTDQPLVRFMYDIGHTVRPNGEILEGRAAPVDDFVPLTRDNFAEYYQVLLERALGVVAAGRAS
ncbi:MAG: hypothetical protein HKN73_18875 [Gemmatimonadetes bacterium]|nr:hypothetical protein [Gemmatimonadota bacterium]